MTDRPSLGVPSPDAVAAVEEFVAGLQAGHDLRDADILNRQFAAGVAWGSPARPRPGPAVLGTGHVCTGPP